MEKKETVVLAAQLFGHEGGSENLGKLIALAKQRGYPGPYSVVSKPRELAQIPSGSILLTDNPARLGQSLNEIISLFARLCEIDCTILIPGTIEITRRSPEAETILALVKIRKAIRSTNIKEGVWYARSRGTIVGRIPVTEAIKARIIEEHCKGLSLTKIFQTLKRDGLEVSRSSIHMVVSDWKARHE